MALPGRREPAPRGDVEPLVRGDGGQVDLSPLVERGGRLLRPARGTRERGFRIGKGLLQGRPDFRAQAVAREAQIGVAVVGDVTQSMPSCVGLDRFARPVEPGAGPGHAIALGLFGHGRQPGDPTATQRLQQEGLGLVSSMMGEQDERRAAGQRHLAQRPVARLARPGFDAFTARRGSVEQMGDEPHRQTSRGPASAHAFPVLPPRVGLGTEAVMDVQREHLHPEWLGRGDRRMEQRRRIEAAAVGDGNDMPRRGHAALSARSCQ